MDGNGDNARALTRNPFVHEGPRAAMFERMQAPSYSTGTILALLLRIGAVSRVSVAHIRYPVLSVT